MFTTKFQKDEFAAKLALELEEAQAELEELKTKLDLVENEVVKAKHAMEKAQAESESLKTELASAKPEFIKLQNRLEVNKSEFELLKAKLVLEKNEVLKAKQAMAELNIETRTELDSAKLEACDARNQLQLLQDEVVVKDYKLKQLVQRNAAVDTSMLELYYVHGYRDAKRERLPLFDIPETMNTIN